MLLQKIVIFALIGDKNGGIVFTMVGVIEG